MPSTLLAPLAEFQVPVNFSTVGNRVQVYSSMRYNSIIILCPQETPEVTIDRQAFCTKSLRDGTALLPQDKNITHLWSGFYGFLRGPKQKRVYYINMTIRGRKQEKESVK